MLFGFGSTKHLFTPVPEIWSEVCLQTAAVTDSPDKAQVKHAERIDDMSSFLLFPAVCAAVTQVSGEKVELGGLRCTTQ